jgi:hypothetical protein
MSIQLPVSTAMTNDNDTQKILASAHRAAAEIKKDHLHADFNELVESYLRAYRKSTEETARQFVRQQQVLYPGERVQVPIAADVPPSSPKKAQPQDWAGVNPSVRCTRAERDAVAELLSRHYEIGSLDDEEFQKRTDLALGAVYRGDLAGLSTDLPMLPPPEPPAPPVQPRYENSNYRTWEPGQWFLQNTVAIGTALTVMAVSVASNDVLLLPSMLICVMINGYLGWRKNMTLAVVGLFSGLFGVLGTALMIALTWRKRVQR